MGQSHGAPRLTLQVTLGRSSTVPAGARPRIWRAGDVGVRTAERLSFGGSSGGLALGPRQWAWEGFVRLAAWPKVATVNVTANLVVAPNAELKLSNNAGAIRATASFWTESSAGVATEHALADFAITAGSSWQHVCLQSNYVAGASPTMENAVWLGGTLQDSEALALSAGDIPHSRRFHFGLLEGVADADIDAASGDIAFDSWRLSNDDRHTIASFTPPVALYPTEGSPTVAIYDLRESGPAYFIQSRGGVARPEWALPRLSKWSDEYLGPWEFSWGGVSAPF